MQNTTFQVDGTTYLLEANCHQLIWPRVIDKVHKQIERIGKKSAADMFGHTASARCYTKINNVLVKFNLTINPKGLNIAPIRS